MASANNGSDKQPPHDDHAMMAWGTIGGALAGALVGLFIGHWVILAIFAGVIGMTIGAIIDRSRR